MDINQSWWLQPFGTSRTYSVSWGNHMTRLLSHIYLAILEKFFQNSRRCLCLSVLRVDYIIAPLKILQSLKESVTAPDEKYSFVRRLSPESAATYNFSKEEVCFLFIFLSYILLSIGIFCAWTEKKIGKCGVKVLSFKVWSISAVTIVTDISLPSPSMGSTTTVKIYLSLVRLFKTEI